MPDIPNRPPVPRPCPDCEVEAAIAAMEHDLRLASLDLWVAGWPPDELIDHVRRTVPDGRAGDLMAWVVLVDDSLRSEQSRPPEWCVAVDRLRAVTGVAHDDLAPGWLARWLRANSTHDTSRAAARLLRGVFLSLGDLVAPVLDAD